MSLTLKENSINLKKEKEKIIMMVQMFGAISVHTFLTSTWLIETTLHFDSPKFFVCSRSGSQFVSKQVDVMFQKIVVFISQRDNYTSALAE